MKRYLSYLIRCLLRHKVERDKVELEQIRWKQQHLMAKGRRCGMTETVFNSMIKDALLSIKLETFINKWAL